LWHLGEKFGFEVETKETPLSKIVVLMPQVTTVIGVQELGAELATIMLQSTMLARGFGMGDSIVSSNWLACSASHVPSS
jgi:hypothetical protein